MTTAIGCAGVAAAIAFAGCGEDDSGSATSSGSASPAAADLVEISDFEYTPDVITVQAGITLSWRNYDKAPHTATADGGAFDTGDLDQGDSKTVTLDEAGTFTYFCRFHPFMKATVEVR